MPTTVTLATALVCFHPLVAGAAESQPPASPTATGDVATPARAAREASTIDSHAGLQNWLMVSPQIYSGSAPRTVKQWQLLKDRGMRTVVSVDGMRPDVTSARKFGLRQVHIPLGYDGIPSEAGAMLARVVRDAAGPIYFHCHHGVHRGPAAAAIAGIAAGSVDAEGALKLLKRAGTSPDYPGLWRDVADYQPPEANAILPPLTPIADVQPLAAEMAKIDRDMTDLQSQIRTLSANRVAPARREAANLALQLQQRLREIGRTQRTELDAAFMDSLAKSAAAAASLRTAVQLDGPSEVERALLLLERSCISCHRRFRDP